MSRAILDQDLRMRITREKAAENRERILKAASRLIREKGISGTGVDTLTEAAGMTHGSLYSQFGCGLSKKPWNTRLPPAVERLLALLRYIRAVARLQGSPPHAASRLRLCAGQQGA